jgi:hypothetical protein
LGGGGHLGKGSETISQKQEKKQENLAARMKQYQEALGFNPQHCKKKVQTFLMIITDNIENTLNVSTIVPLL